MFRDGGVHRVPDTGEPRQARNIVWKFQYLTGLTGTLSKLLYSAIWALHLQHHVTTEVAYMHWALHIEPYTYELVKDNRRITWRRLHQDQDDFWLGDERIIDRLVGATTRTDEELLDTGKLGLFSLPIIH